MNKLLMMLAPMLLSRGGRRIAGRNAGKLALAGMVFNLLKKRRSQPRRR